MPRLIQVNPDHLDAWVETSGRLNETLANRTERLVGEYGRVVPGLDWGTLDATSLLTAMGDYIGANDVDRAWVATIAQAFRDLDGRYSDGVPESIIVDHLAASGLDGGREAVTFDDPVALGMPASSGFANDPVSTATGNMVEAEVDLRLPDSAGPLRMPRTYNSRFRRDGVFGAGWTSWLDVGLVRNPTGDANRAVVTFPDGHRVGFLHLAGQWRAPPGCHARLTVDVGGRFRLDHANGDVWTLDAVGRLEQVEFGVHAVTFDRDDRDRVVALHHSNGRVVEVEWAGAQVAAVTNDDGQRAEYVMDEHDHLVEVAADDGTRRHEVAPDGQLVASFDADGVLSFRNTYDDQDRVVTQLSSFGRLTRFTYALSGITIVDDDQGGPRTTFIHDDKGRLVGVVDDDGNHQATTFDVNGNAIASIDRTGATTTRMFDDRGRPVRIIDPGGAVTHLVWDDQGRIVRREGPDGAVVELSYADRHRHPHRVVDAMGAVTECRVEAGEVVTVTDPDGVVTRLERDRDGMVTAMVEADGATTAITRDGVGEIVDVTAPDGRTTTFERDAGGHVTGRRLADGTTTRWERTAAGRVVGSTAPTGATSTIDYGNHGEIAAITDPTGATLDYEWDDNGNLVRVSDSHGASVVHAHDSLSRLVALTDPTGRTWRREHDGAGRITATVDPGGARQERTHTPTGRVATTTDAIGRHTQFDYDRAGRLRAVTDPAGGRTTADYDTAGRQIAMTAPSGNTTTLSWTAGGRLAARRDSDGDEVRFTYDIAGRLASATTDAGALEVDRGDHGQVAAVIGIDGRRQELVRDGQGRIVGIDDGTGPGWRTEFDHAGRPIRDVGPDGATSTFDRDLAGRLEAVTDPLGGVTRFEHDDSGMLTGTIDPTGVRQLLEHDAAGRLVASVDGLGRRTEVDHDPVGRVTAHRAPDGTEMRLDHDPAGRVVGLTGRDGTELSVELDALGRPVAITDGARRVEQAFDQDGRLVGRSVDGRDHHWNREGRRLDVTGPDGTVTSYQRDAAGRVIGIIHPVVGQATVTRDRAGRPLRLVAPGLERRWWWDDRGLLERMDQSVGDRSTSVTVTRDDAGRVVGLDDARGTTRFTYDAAGQLVKLATPGEGVRTFAYEHGRRVAEVAPDGTTRRFRHDAAGQLVAVEGSDGVTRLAYDELGRRIERRGPDGEVVRYGWGGRNQLTTISTTPGDGAGAQASTVRLEVGPTGDLVAVDGIGLDWDHTTGMPTVARVGDRDIIGPGTPLAIAPAGARREATNDPGGVDQIEAGGDGAPDAASAAASGDRAAAVGAWLGRDVFGTPWLDDAVATSVGLASGTAVDLAGPLGLGTHGELTIDGLVWLRMRVLDPDTATFLSPDPLPPVLGGGQVANPYHFAANNPVGAVDPWGLQPLTDAELAAFNDRASRGLGTRIADGAANFVDDPIGWAADNWEGIATGVLVVAGGIMIATGVGAPIGVGLIAGATLSMGGQIAMTGEVDARATLISTIGGGASGGMGGLFASASVPVQVGVGAGTDALVSTGSQYATTGTVDPWAVGLDTVIGGVAAGGGAWWQNTRGSRAPGVLHPRTQPTAASLAETVDALPQLPPQHTPSFVVHPNGEIVVVPEGAVGPIDSWSGRGVRFTGGSGGPGLDARVSEIRIMDSSTNSKFPHPNGYVSYANAGGQTVNPSTGQTISKDHPAWHTDWSSP